MQKQYEGLKRLNEKNSNKMIYSQTFIKRSPYKTGDLLKEVQFKLNFLWQVKKRVTI